VANVAWKSEPAVGSYPRGYWDRLQVLGYPFLSADLQESVSIALRFTLAQPGVCTAIVGTKNPDRWLQNAKILELPDLPAEQIEAIRARWNETAQPDWDGLG
jgi:hypothetical protein